MVIPAYNNEKFIEATVESVLAQTFTDFELIISDHSSTDRTWELLQRFTEDPRVQLTRLKAGGGAPANWTAVTDLAGGELLKLVCGDDLLYPTALAEQVAAFDRYPQAVLVASLRDVVDADGSPVVRSRGLPGLSGLVSGEAAIRRTVSAGTNAFGEPMCVLVRREVLISAGGWDARTPYLLDQATFVRVLRHGPMVALRRCLAAFRISAGQWSVDLVRQQARQARNFHASVQGQYPGLLRRWDRPLGDVRATAMAFGRRGVYLWLRLRRKDAGDGPIPSGAGATFDRLGE